MVEKQNMEKFRQEAVKLSQEIGISATIERLGIKLKTLHKWIGKAKTQAEMDSLLARIKTVDELKDDTQNLRKQIQELEEKNKNLAYPILFEEGAQKIKKSERIAYIKANLDRFSTNAMCRMLGISETGFYKHLRKSQGSVK